MATWAERRKFMYALAVIIFIVGVIGIPAFLLIYKAPTCFDGKQNGGERGVDCGGKCTRLCQSEFLSPNVAWARIEKVVPGVYNAAAYIINPNTEGEAENVPYKMSLFDKDGMLIIEQVGKVTIPPHRNTLAFNSLMKVDSSIPAKVLFEFTNRPDWYKKIDTLSSVVVTNKEYKEDGDKSSLLVSFMNDSLNSIGRMSVFAILYDKDGNSVGFSRTIVDAIAPKSTVVAPFTWNTNRQGEVVSIEVLYMAE